MNPLERRPIKYIVLNNKEEVTDEIGDINI